MVGTPVADRTRGALDAVRLAAGAAPGDVELADLLRRVSSALCEVERFQGRGGRDAAARERLGRVRQMAEACLHAATAERDGRVYDTLADARWLTGLAVEAVATALDHPAVDDPGRRERCRSTLGYLTHAAAALDAR